MDEASGATNPAVGVLRYGSVQGEQWAAGESCVLPPDQAAVCAAVTTDFVDRGWGFDLAVNPAG